jgi:hypothetical protein
LSDIELREKLQWPKTSASITIDFGRLRKRGSDPMEILVLTGVAALLLAAAGYAQYRIPRHTAGNTKVIVARAILAVVGAAFGYVMSTVYIETRGFAAVLVFLIGFGLVHLPAALILFMKRSRGTGKS